MSTLASEPQEEDEPGKQDDTHICCNPNTPCLYSLTAGPLARPVPHETGDPSPPSSCCNSPSSAARSRKEPDLNPLIHPSDHIKTLLSQLGSSIPALKASFALMRASSSSSFTPAENASGAATEKVMANQLQTFSDLHMKLYFLGQQYDFGMNQDRPYETSSSTNESIPGPHVERPETMLKWYEGVISRFHEEMRKKDAVTEALKETLGRSMLKAEKLERRIKGLQGQFSQMQLK